MSEDKDIKPDFEPTKSSTEALDRLIDVSKSSAQAMIWTKNQENIISGKIHLPPRVSDSFYVLTPQDASGQRFVEKAGKSPGTECLFNIPLSVGQLFFKTELQIAESKRLQFQIPKVIYRVQRRQHVRFVIPLGHVLKMSFQDPKASDKLIEKKVLDISAGGLSFLTSAEEEGIYPANTILKKVTFKIHLAQIQTEAKIAHVKALPENPENTRLKVGVEFFNLSVTQTQKIASYVLEESSKFLPRLA